MVWQTCVSAPDRVYRQPRGRHTGLPLHKFANHHKLMAKHVGIVSVSYEGSEKLTHAESVPRAAASEALSINLLIEPRSLPLAALTSRFITHLTFQCDEE